MSGLYEKFILNFYKLECEPEVEARSEFIEWDATSGEALSLLPKMKTDISLYSRRLNKLLIVDIKFYPNALQTNFDHKTFISSNMYQIYSYVQNCNFDGEVSGMLLYPTVEYSLEKCNVLSGNKFSDNTRNDRIAKIMSENAAVKIIPAAKDERAVKGAKLRVVAYCRVSTDKTEQLTSYSVQTKYYADLINENSDWVLVGIYTEAGLSGTSTKKRTECLRMIEDYKKGKIDLVITKDVSRFSRNTLDCLIYVRTHLALENPVSVFFEGDNLTTDKDMPEEQLIIRAMVAQADSERRSFRVKWSRRILFSKGAALIPTHCLLGYTKDSKGNVIIGKREAKVIRYIYQCYLDGA